MSASKIVDKNDESSASFTVSFKEPRNRRKTLQSEENYLHIDLDFQTTPESTVRDTAVELLNEEKGPVDDSSDECDVRISQELPSVCADHLERKMDFEDILIDVGDSGRYQKGLILIFLLPSAVLLPWFSMNVLFMVSVPEHWCAVPVVASSNLTIEQQRMLISPPSNPKCHMYDINYTDYITSGNFSVPNDTTTRPCTNGWDFDKTEYESTAATQWNMFCDDDHYTSFILTMYNVGSIIGTPIYGSLSDRIGRKITFFIVLTVTAISAIASVLMTDFTAFVIIKTINGSLMPSVFQLPYIIILELVAPEMRTHMNGLVNCSWTIGLCFLPLIAYFSRSWVTLGIITSSVTIIFFFYWRYLPESPRWLVSQEKYKEAMIIMQNIGEKNGTSPDPDILLAKLQTLGEKMKKEKTIDNVKNSPMDLLRYPQLRKIFLIITWCWIADVMAYYGLQLNVTNLAGNEFINFFLTSIVEIPGYITAWILMDKFGRRWIAAGGFFCTGVVCMMPGFVLGLPYSDIICSMMGKFCASATFMATYQQSSELYPTVVRSLGMGMSSTLSMTVSLVTPYLIYLSVHGKAIPFIVIGSVSIIASILATFLPETLNENLPQTISDAEVFAKNQKFFSWNRRRRSVSRERAASLALQLKTFEILGFKEEKDKKNNKSNVLQNSDFVKEKKYNKNPNDVEKAVNCNTPLSATVKVNNDTHVKMQNRNSNISVTDVGKSTNELQENKDASVIGKPIQYAYEQNVEVEMPENKQLDTSQQANDNFAYVNTSFDNRDSAKVINIDSMEEKDLNAENTDLSVTDNEQSKDKSV